MVEQDYIERREYPRIAVERAIYIEVASRASRSEADSTIFRCETVDISVGGLRIRVPEPIVQGSKLNIGVPMDEWKENLELAGEVMWVGRADDDNGYWVGLQLEDTSREDMEKWYRAVQFLKG